MTTLSDVQYLADTYLVANNRGSVTGPVLHSLFSAIIGALSSLSNSRIPVADADYGATIHDGLVAYTSITAPRTVTLPAANTGSNYTKLIVLDESGNCASSRYIRVVPSGADVINGQAAPVLLQSPYSAVTLECNDSSGWVIVSRALTPVTEPLTGATDGSNAVFSTSHVPLPGSVIAFGNGLATLDFVVSGSSLTFTTAPASGAAMLTQYLI